MGAKILTHENKTKLRPNEIVGGTVEWSSALPPESAILQLFYFTEGKGSRDVVVQAEEAFAMPLAHDSRSFEFQLPAAPWSFVGRLVSIHWAIELILDHPPRDEVARLPIIVSPTLDVIDIYDHEAVPNKQTMSQEFWQSYTG